MVDCFVSLSDSCSLRSSRITFGTTRCFFMNCLIWGFGCWLLPAASAVPLRKLLGLIVDYFCGWRGGVNVVLLRGGWLMVNLWWLIDVRDVVKRGRSVSITYETLRTGSDFSGEDFQNTGTFMVVRSSVFSRCSAHKVQLARDAYFACKDWSSGCQDKKRHHEIPLKIGCLWENYQLLNRVCETLSGIIFRQVAEFQCVGGDHFFVLGIPAHHLAGSPGFVGHVHRDDARQSQFAGAVQGFAVTQMIL